MLDRRHFLAASAAGVAAALAPRLLADEPKKKDPLFKISLAQWSHNKAFFAFLKDRPGDKKDPLKFAETAKKDYDIAAVEYVNQFYMDKKKDKDYLKDLKKMADDNGVTSVLNLGDPDAKRRATAVWNHLRWVEWAKHLGCHSIRVNAASDWKKGFEETQKLAADGLRNLCELGDKHGLNVIVENHGGLSSHGEWLAGVMKKVDHKRVGTLPDFGNFGVGKIDGVKLEGVTDGQYDRYKGVDELMPYAKGVSAKTHDFDDKGNETHTDYRKMLEVVLTKHKYRGFVGIEYEGGKVGEAEGVKLTKKLLETVRDEMSKG